MKGGYSVVQHFYTKKKKNWKYNVLFYEINKRKERRKNNEESSPYLLSISEKN